MAFKMKGFHMPGIAGVKAERDKINKLSGKTQEVMKVKPKNEFSTIASRNDIYNSRVVAQGADQEDVDSEDRQAEKENEESKKTSGFPKNGDPKTKTMTGHELPGPMQRKKFYGDRSRKDMRQDIREERKSLKDEGGTREEVKDFNANQRNRKLEIRADELDSRGRTKRADKKRSKVKKPDAPQLGEAQVGVPESQAPISHIAGGPNAGYWQKNKDGVKVRVPNPNPGTSKAQTSTTMKKATHKMPDGTVMPGAKHRQ